MQAQQEMSLVSGMKIHGMMPMEMKSQILMH